jgi:iron complex outermembrane receptor protein
MTHSRQERIEKMVEKQVKLGNRCFIAFLVLGLLWPGWALADSIEKSRSGKADTVNTKFDEITVTGTRPRNPAMPETSPYAAQHNIVTEEKIKEQHVYDLPSTLRNVPGVMFQSKNLMGGQTNHSLYIRGRGANHPGADFAVEFDGVPRFGAIFGQVLGDGIAVPTIGSIEVFKSPQPSQFGTGYASVNILPKYMKVEGKEIKLDVSGGSYATFSQSMSGGVKQGPFDFYLSQSWVSTDGHTDHSRAQQQNYYANTGYEINKHWSVRLLANYVKSQTAAPRPDITPTAANSVSWPAAERFDTETMLTTLTLNHHYEKAIGYLKTYRNDTDFDLLQELTSGNRYAGGTDGLWSRQAMSLFGIRAKEKFHLWRGGEILFGADLDMAELKNTQRTYSGSAVAGINGGRAERLWNYPDTTLFSPYLAVSQMIGKEEGLHAIPSAGIRYFTHNEFEDKASTQAGLVVGYGQTDLAVRYARGVNYPSPVVVMNMVVNTAAVNNPAQYWEKINPEVVDHYEVSLTHTWPQKASLGITAFSDKGKDRFQAYMFGAIPTAFNDPIGKYKIEGWELTGTLTPIKTLEIFAAATWLSAKAQGNNSIERDHLPYTPEFQFQAGVNWTFLEHFRLSLDMQHLQDVYAGTSARSGSFNFSQLAESSKLDDFMLFNARLGYHFDYKSLGLRDAELFIAVNNMFDEDYEDARGYKMPGLTAFAGFSIRM